MSAFEQIAPNAPPQPNTNIADELVNAEFRAEIYKPMREFFDKEGLPAVTAFANAADDFRMNRNNIVLENAEAHYNELLQKMATHPAYKERREQMEKHRTAFGKLIEDLTIYREYVKTTKKEIKFFPLLESYSNWLRSATTERPEEQAPATSEKTEQSLQKKLASAYVEYLRQMHGGDNFENITNLDLIEARGLFSQPSSEKYDERVSARHRQAMDMLNHEVNQMHSAEELSTPQYQLFAKYKKYFSGEQTLPFLVPDEDFYRLDYEKQAQIIIELEAQSFFVREDLRRVKFPETAKDRMFPKDVLARIDPRLRQLAQQYPDKLMTFFQAAETTSLGTFFPDTQPAIKTKTLKEIAEKNTQTQLDKYMGTAAEPHYEGDLTDPQIFASALEFYRLCYKDSLFQDVDIITRLKKQKEIMLEQKINDYVNNFIKKEVQERLELLDDSPHATALRFQKQIAAEAKSQFSDTIAAHQLKTKIWEKITDYIFDKLETELNMQIALADGSRKSALKQILYKLPAFRRASSCYQSTDYHYDFDLARTESPATYHDDFLETLANKPTAIRLYHLAITFNKTVAP